MGGGLKKWKTGEGVFCKKSGLFLNAGRIMYSISIFYFTFYLFGGCVRTQRTPPAHVPALPRPHALASAAPHRTPRRASLQLTTSQRKPTTTAINQYSHDAAEDTA